jgi:hypothetical protein
VVLEVEGKGTAESRALAPAVSPATSEVATAEK